MSDVLEEFDDAVLQEAWRFVQEDDMGLATKIEKAVKAGVTPETLSRRYLGIAGAHRAPMAKRVENAARYLQSMHLERNK